MFFLADLSQTVFIPPSHFDAMLKNKIPQLLYDAVEGQSDMDVGYILCVTKVVEVGSIQINSDGYGQVNVKYRALVIKPVVGEVLDASIEQSNTMGIFSAVGPVTIFISNYQIPQHLQMNIECLQEEKNLRMKIIGVKIDKAGSYAIGTINEENLGIIY